MVDTDELLRAFSAVDDPHAVLAVIGSIPKEREAVLLPLIEADERIRYLGWKSGADLQEYLCAADLYCQPGSQSATMQNALCRYCPVMLYPHPSHTADYDRGEVLWVKTQADMEAVFRSLAADPAQLAPLRENAERLIDAALMFGDVVSTGRNAPEWLREKADYVSEIIARKHPFQTEKLAAREGIEY